MSPEMLPELPRDLPRLVLAERVLDKIVQGALRYPEPETGEAMVGLIVPQPGRLEPDVYVLETISPGPDAVREWGRFEQGDDWQGDVFHWWHVNWEAFRELRRPSYGKALAAKWDVPLAHVGDWHKQPGDMIAPSGGDARTARAMIEDKETPVELVVAPIVTMYPLTEVSTNEEGVEEASVQGMPSLGPQSIVRRCEEEGWLVRIDFWYMSRRAPRFVAVAPVVWPDDRLPALPPLAWHLAHPRRFEQEYDLLREAGYTVDVVRWDADGRPPYEICFAVFKEGASQVVLLVTGMDYPNTMPAVRVAPLVTVEEDQDMFETLYAASRPLLTTQLPDWPWDSRRTLIELVWHVEKSAPALKVDGAS
ncbi:MAG: hypothetical protein KatS3mg051_0247 [Anaerolineae bacterium]|nr:MAG: hypothetical protein KatS3mg051_0247 [Anaerolineae bacterium]